ncbi:MAG TPA: hypothetical protein VGJ20_20475 [Xanthobacteraceae bacterium]|jgi:hypothetical protein
MPLAVLLNPDDPIFDFEHMMAHREYFAVMTRLANFSILPYLLDPSFDMDQPAWWWNQRHQRAHDDFNNDLPSNYANGYTLTTVTPAPAHGTGTSTGTTSLSMTAVTGTILIGAAVAGAGVPAGTTIVSQASGATGGDGTYITSAATTLAADALTITHPPYQQANPLQGGTFGIPQAQILLEGNGRSPENRSWWTFANHQEHYIANNAILPLPTTAPTTAGTPPGEATVSNPWWWINRAPVIYPFW